MPHDPKVLRVLAFNLYGAIKAYEEGIHLASWERGARCLLEKEEWQPAEEYMQLAQFVLDHSPEWHEKRQKHLDEVLRRAYGSEAYGPKPPGRVQ